MRRNMSVLFCMRRQFRGSRWKKPLKALCFLWRRVGCRLPKRWYEITYYRPEPANQNVSWKDNQGNEGEILRNSFHNQESYYPVWIQENEITFRGTRLKDNAVPENGLWVGYCYPWGYADNHRNDKEGSNFKIDWAIDSNGESIVLDCIDFVKIMTAVNQDAGQMGEISTEVTTVENLHFKN